MINLILSHAVECVVSVMLIMIVILKSIEKCIEDINMSKKGYHDPTVMEDMAQWLYLLSVLIIVAEIAWRLMA